jgi:GntR family transcriptional regulator, rspAB operon transcriptional repressor
MSTAKIASSLTEIAYRRIKEEILDNHLRPGEPIETDRFVRELGLSRTPVREAVLRLEKEGFIDIRPRMGTFVSHLDLRQIQEMYQVRRTLEGLAAREAAGVAAAARLAALEKELKSYDTGPRADLEAISAAGEEVHQLILECCQNRVLAGMISSLHDHFRRFRSLSLHIREKVLSSHQEHLAILLALQRGDGEAAENLIHAHFDHAARALLDTLLLPCHSGAAACVTVDVR